MLIAVTSQPFNLFISPKTARTETSWLFKLSLVGLNFDSFSIAVPNSCCIGVRLGLFSLCASLSDDFPTQIPRPVFLWSFCWMWQQWFPFLLSPSTSSQFDMLPSHFCWHCNLVCSYRKNVNVYTFPPPKWDRNIPATSWLAGCWRECRE